MTILELVEGNDGWIREPKRVNPPSAIVNACAEMITEGLLNASDIRSMQKSEPGSNLLRLVVRDHKQAGDLINSALIRLPGE